jgi:triphosphoribosyl-dephospho-CoA synthase
VIEAAYLEACTEELLALKPGNVHIHAPGHGMTVADFIRSAQISAPLLCRPNTPLGLRILNAASATRTAIGQNTNLGILLLCGPLAMAAEQDKPVGTIIATATQQDTDAVYEAIRIANPGGLGSADRYDVRDTPTVTLSQAMAQAADRDSIARQWTNGFADILLPTYATARQRWTDPSRAAQATYIEYLCKFPDSHVARKHGAAIASRLQHKARQVAADIAICPDPTPLLLSWDKDLKAQHINPGTSADMTVATAFAWRLGLHLANVDG